jgi:hypothetical protein
MSAHRCLQRSAVPEVGLCHTDQDASVAAVCHCVRAYQQTLNQHHKVTEQDLIGVQVDRLQYCQ